MRNYEEFEAKVIESLQNKKKKRKNATTIALTLCVSAITVSVIAIMPSVLKSQPALDEILPPVYEQDYKAEDSDVPIIEGNDDSALITDDADVTEDTSKEQLENSSEPSKSAKKFFQDDAVCKEIYYLLNGNISDNKILSCAYLGYNGTHSINIYYQTPPAESYVITQNTVLKGDTSYEISSENLEKLLSLLEG